MSFIVSLVQTDRSNKRDTSFLVLHAVDYFNKGIRMPEETPTLKDILNLLEVREETLSQIISYIRHFELPSVTLQRRRTISEAFQAISCTVITWLVAVSYVLFCFNSALRLWRRGNIGLITTQPLPDCVNSKEHEQSRCLEDRFLSQLTRKRAPPKHSRFSTSFPPSGSPQTTRLLATPRKGDFIERCTASVIRAQ